MAEVLNQYGSDKLSETFFNKLDAAIVRQSSMVISIRSLIFISLI
jgi:hypothetical protein